MDLQRRNWLRGRFRTGNAVIPPPWLRSPETLFDQCTRCLKCADACPERIVIGDENGFPTLDFQRGECTFCGYCADACPEHLFRADRSQQPWDLIAAIDQNCLNKKGVVCRGCEDACEAQALRFPPRIGGVSIPQLDTERCTGCGACVAVCPTRAIRVGLPDSRTSIPPITMPEQAPGRP